MMSVTVFMDNERSIIIYVGVSVRTLMTLILWYLQEVSESPG